MKSRLKKLAFESNDDNISLEEAYQDIKIALKKMRSRISDWAVRDDLKQFTSWGFYKGSDMASIDDEVAIDILKQLSEYVEENKNSDSLLEIYNILARYAA